MVYRIEYDIQMNLCFKTSVWSGVYILPLDKMAASLADDIFRSIFVNEKYFDKISLMFVPGGPIDNNATLV